MFIGTLGWFTFAWPFYLPSLCIPGVCICGKRRCTFLQYCYGNTTIAIHSKFLASVGYRPLLASGTSILAYQNYFPCSLVQYASPRCVLGVLYPSCVLPLPLAWWTSLVPPTLPPKPLSFFSDSDGVSQIPFSFKSRNLLSASCIS